MVYIDESGTTSELEQSITLASVWCAPVTKEGHLSVLKYTADMVKSEIEVSTGKWPNEIHFSSGLRRYSDSLVDTAINSSVMDSSIHKKDLPWMGRPMAFRTVTFSPLLESALPGRDTHFHKNLRARGIIALLMPLLLYSDEIKTEVSVILDDEVWNGSIDVCEVCLKKAVNHSSANLHFHAKAAGVFPVCRLQTLPQG